MGGSGVGCTLWVDGARVADGSPGDDPDDPTALSGLAIAWGRATTVDQPEPSTCTVQLFDEPGARSLLDVVHVGSTLEVTATGTVYPDPTESTFTDPGFETAVYATGTNANAVRSTRRAHAGAAAAAVRATDPARRGSVILAPAPFSNPEDPGVWDAIPTTGPAQTWRVSAALFVPVGITVTVRPVLFTAPWASAATVQAGPATSLVGASPAAWRDVTLSFVPAQEGCWVGVQVEVWPTGPAWDDVEAALSWDAVAAAWGPDWTWDDVATVYVDDVEVLAPAAGTEQTVLAFSGRVTDLRSGYDETIGAAGAPVLEVTAADFTADLDNTDVGDEPWPQESLAARVQRILDLVNTSAGGGLPVTAVVDDTVADTVVSWRDVDRQSARGLLAELAASVDAVLWSAVHRVTGPYLHVEDPAARPPADVLALVDGVVRIVPATGSGVEVSACDLLLDPATWRQTVADVATRVAVTWLEEGVDDDGQTTTTERTVTVVDTDRESAWGARGYSLSTQLTAAGDAGDVAGRILARTGLGWRADGLTLDDDPDTTTSEPAEDPTVQVTRVLTLLDGTPRNGLLLRLRDLPAWAPGAPDVNVYLEGGTYTYEDGRWVLDLTASAGTGTGATATWDDLPDDPAWAWDDVDPAITWDQLRGVGVAEGST